MAKRPPAAPPDLPGYRPISHLGSGGFADVFLYQQELPHREVAVKVLVASVVDSATRQRFVAEANAMARLSAHPSIVTIYFAGVAPDGRPCLVMEYCPRPHLGLRMRRERIEVAEALRTGIRLASAVETAHRAGILHRDIKPANVLVTAYGRPKLADFGISAQLDATMLAEGLSVPWSAPELFGSHPRSDVTTDVYALGATIYALLAGRAPFEIRGGENSASDMIGRIERQPVPPIGRSDVPAVLEQTLARSMHKRSEARFRTAYDLARTLQVVESELGLPRTEIEVLTGLDPDVGDGHGDNNGDDPAATRQRSVITISDEPGVQVADRRRPAPSRVATPAPGVPASAMLGPLPDSTGTRPAPKPRVGPLIVGAVAALAVLGTVVAVVLWGPDAGSGPGAGATGSAVPLVRQSPLGAPAEASCTRTGRELTCRWTQPGPGQARAWHWRLSADERVQGSVEAPEVTLTLPDESTPPCLSVVAVGETGATSPATTMCAR